ncbi:MAG: hypothetical protein LBS86_08060 [Treponema sp.]|nr:hypothetical protein [Treponema sp.]
MMRGAPNSAITTDGQSISCYKQAVARDFFSERHAFGCLAAVSIYNSESAAILRLYYTD